jgi:hypothetical protein
MAARFHDAEFHHIIKLGYFNKSNVVQIFGSCISEYSCITEEFESKFNKFRLLRNKQNPSNQTYGAVQLTDKYNVK